MDRQTAARLIQDTFENPFDKEKFRRFVKNLLNRIEDAPFVYKGNFIPDAYARYVSTLERIGKYGDGDHKIDILVVKLRKETSIERGRTMQRNFIAWYLNGSRGGEMKDAALAAFVSPDQDDWRFSLVKMDYAYYEDKKGRTKVRGEFTPARRWSFLVGRHENSHTAQSRLAPILADDEHNPTLTHLEEAFNIETVTKEFFGKYRELFLRTRETLDTLAAGNRAVETDFASKDVNAIDFAKKLLGQIVFLYFLQKKGWFGVSRDGVWGTGPRGFLRELFVGKHGTYDNFFNDILEPLFYEALASEREDSFYKLFNCKIPFLNGGLFDPICGYDWVHTDILLPNELFSNDRRTREGDKGDGILDIFDRYNFTVKEDEPLEKEVAVDPEMLGKVFENLLEVKDRRSKGTYYTPREIVHYMCRQSLINYLDTELNGGPVAYERIGTEQLDMFGNKAKSGQWDLEVEHASNPAISKGDIEKLIECGEQVGENEATVEAKGRETETYSYKLPEDIRRNAKAIDGKLAAILVCDPAIGSGAFPVGMMSEIVKARNVLSVFIKAPERTPYHFKRECIENSLYGVDIDPGAVEIAKLRLWLSLVVDEDDIREIKPLPNLDYKIVCGDSLGSVGRDVLNDQLFAELEALKRRYFDETSPGKKKEEKARIDALISQLTHNESRFDYHIFFHEAFDHGNGGFDVVIANPPYVRQEGIKDLKPALKREFGPFFCGTADIYTYFYKRGTELLKTGGHLCFIAPNKFMRAGYGRNTRELLTEKVTPKIIIDFGELPVFEAGTDPLIVLVEKRKGLTNGKCIGAIIKSAEEIERVDDVVKQRGFAVRVSSLLSRGWTLEQPEVLRLMEKLRAAGKPLGEYVRGRLYRGILTGLNEAFVIDESIRGRLIAEDPKSGELIKPWLRGRDIKKWKAEWAGLYLITIPSSANKAWPWSTAKTEKEALGIFAKTYPAVCKHLTQWGDRLRKRDDQGRFWWELRSCAYYKEFEKLRVVYPDIATHMRAGVAEDDGFADCTTFIMPFDVYVLALMHSRLFDWYYRLNFQCLGDPHNRGRIRFKTQYMEQLPIPSIHSNEQAPIFSLVQQVLAAPDSPDVPRLEAEIDRLVYDLYGLTPEEIEVVKGSDKARSLVNGR
jgi:type I restriction-modification system DNA methylase subunit